MCDIFYIAHLSVRYFFIFYIAHLGVRYEIYTLAFPFDLRCQSGIYIYICNSYNTGKSALPDIYARCPSAYISGKARVPVL